MPRPIPVMKIDVTDEVSPRTDAEGQTNKVPVTEHY